MDTVVEFLMWALIFGAAACGLGLIGLVLDVVIVDGAADE